MPPTSSGIMFPPTTVVGSAKEAVTPQTGADATGKDSAAWNPFTDFLASLGPGIGNAFMSNSAAVPSLLDRLLAGATNFATGGSPVGGVLNSVRGLATGERTDPAGIRQANQSATFDALVSAGVAPQFARVAALNPDVLRTVVAAHFNALSPRKTGTPGVAPGGSPQSSIAGDTQVEAADSRAPADTAMGQEAGFAGSAGPAISRRLPGSRPAQADRASQPARPLDARLANLRRQLLSGPAVLPLVRAPRPFR
jgi:hypothetical protein